MDVVGTVVALWRYPVKSMAGEPLAETWVGPAGITGDRAWALLDGEGNWASAKANRQRWRVYDGMLDLRTRTAAEHWPATPLAGSVAPLAEERPSEVVVTLPDGREAVAGRPEADALLSAHLGAPLRFDHGDGGRRWGRHHDSVPLHLVTDASLAALAGEDGAPLDARRLRPNVVLRVDGRGFVEDGWVGRRLRVGAATLQVVERTARCVMTTREQAPAGLPREPDVLPRIGRRNDACAGISLTVVEPGAIRVGDPATLLG